ncbi:MAG: glycosyltransferase [Gemmatimonadota bacterium]|nr:glycosyltransferase [Gemmatimonadota bacterium]
MSTPSALQSRVSVIIPVYGTAHFVAEALDSVLSQTNKDYEIIVVNDGSPDSKLLDEVLVPYLGRITYIVQENRGLAAARNTALKLARSQYAAMLDSDDRWHPDYLASQIAILDADPTIDVVYPDAVRFGSASTKPTRYSEEYPMGGDISFLRVLSRECQIYGGVTARRETLLRVGLYDEELRSAQDFDLWLRVLKGGGRITYNDRVLAYYRTREGSQTSDGVTLCKYVLMILDKVGREMKLTAEERATLDRQRADTAAMLSLFEGKRAFIEGDTRTAITKLKVAADHTNSWKLQVAIVCLRIAPSILHRLYRVRQSWERRRAEPIPSVAS